MQSSCNLKVACVPCDNCRVCVKMSKAISAVCGSPNFVGMQKTLHSLKISFPFFFSAFRSKICMRLSQGIIIKPPKQGRFWMPCFRGRNPKVWTCIFKSGSLLNVWHSLVKLHLGGIQKQKERTWVKHNGLPCTRIGTEWPYGYISVMASATAPMTPYSDAANHIYITYPKQLYFSHA